MGFSDLSKNRSFFPFPTTLLTTFIGAAIVLIFFNNHNWSGALRAPENSDSIMEREETVQCGQRPGFNASIDHTFPGVISRLSNALSAPPIRRYPWLAAVMIQYANGSKPLNSICVGSIVSKNYVLTAAHCVADALNKNEKYLIVTGSAKNWDRSFGDHTPRNRLGCPSIFNEVKQIHVHPDYGPILDVVNLEPDNDIALLELEHPLEFGVLRWPICLPKNYDYEMETRILENRTIFSALIAGWGNTFAADIMINETRTYGKFDPLISPSLLHDGVVKIRRMDECRRSRYEFQIAQCKLKADLCFEVCQEAGQRCLELCEVARNELEFCNRLEWTEEGRREMEESWERLRKTNMCTKSVASNFELGDSGAPLMLSMETDGHSAMFELGLHTGAVGIRIALSDPPRPRSYTRISPYCDWINNVTKGRVKCIDAKPIP